MKNGSSDLYTVNMKLSTVTKWITLGGIMCILVVNILDNTLSTDFLKKYYAVKPILDILNTIGGTLFSAGIVSILVEISTLKGLVSDALSRVLQGNVPLDSYSNDILEKLNKKIAAKRGNVNIEKVNNSIYSVEPKLIGLLDDLYYNYYNATYDIIADEKQGVFHKNITLDYEIINEYGKPNSIAFTVSLYNANTNMSDEEKKREFIIKSFKINETDLTSEANNYKKIVPIEQKHSEYQYAVKFERELQKCKSHKIHLELKYDVPKEDLSQVFRATHPCKSMKHEIFVVNSPNWVVHGTGFTSFYIKEDNNNSFHVTYKQDSVLLIEFDDWSIPGAGYVAYLAKKQ